MALEAGTIEGELLVVECDEAAAVVRFLQNITLQCPQHHTAVSTVQYSTVQYTLQWPQHHTVQTIVTTLSFIQRMKYVRHLFMRTVHY